MRCEHQQIEICDTAALRGSVRLRPLLWSLVFGVWCLAAAAPTLQAQPLLITTLAGSPGQGSADGTGASARFANPWGVAADTNGNLYIADTDNHTIRKIAPGGIVTTLAGHVGLSGSTNGTGTNALFFQPQGVAVDGLGNVYVADTGNQIIRKITPGGAVSTLAGLAGASGTNDGTGGLARFYEPEGIAVNAGGTLLYVADTWNHTLRQITAGGVVLTLAGSASNSGTNDGSGSGALFYQPQGVALDSAGNIYVGDTGNETIRKVTPLGAVTTVAGSAGNYGAANGSGGSATFWAPQGLALDAANNIYVADSLNHTIRKITPSGSVTNFAGTSGNFGSADGTTPARFWLPQSVAADTAGNVYVADSANGTIRRITSAGVVSTLAGSASAGSADGPGSGARFSGPAGAAIDSSGNVYVADTGNGTIRVVTSGGGVSTLAGFPGSFGATDGTNAGAQFYGPQATALDSSGNLYVADTANHTIRKVTSSGVVTTLAGSAGTNGMADGTGSNARFNFPQGLAVDTLGNLYVADTWNHAIRKVTPAGVVTTLAGVPGLYGNIDGTSLGTGTNAARFYCPSGLTVDTAGNVYVADTRNHTVRKVTSSGAVSTLAGMPGVWGSADGTNSGSRFNQPQDIAVDFNGNLYVLDSGNHTVRMVAPVGTNWVVTTIAGVPGVSGSADGTDSGAQFFYPGGIGVNNVGAFGIADTANNTIRTGISSLNASPVILVQPQNQAVNENQAATISVTAAGSAPLTYQWLFYSTNLAGATASSYTCTNAQPSNAGPYSVIISNSLGSTNSAVALVTVVVPPAVTNTPQNLTINQGQNATFNVGASGTAPFGYQWLYGGAAIAAANSSSYTRTNAQPGDSGNYSVIVSNSAGSVTSAPALLTVNSVPTPPGINGQPQNLTVSQTSNATFTVTATGSTPFSYQWLFFGTNLASGTASSYTVLNSQPANAGPYSVIVTNAYGSITSSTATLSVILPPIIGVQPVSQLAAVSNSVSFTVGLSQGTSPAYQWQQNGMAIAGATQSGLTLPSISWNSAGTYSVVVSNLAGSQTSADAVLTVEQAPCTFFEGFESYHTGILDNNLGGPNTTPSNPWWALTSTTQGSVTNSATGVTPHSGAQMAGRTGTSYLQDYVNLVSRLNAGRPYYGNFMCEWWFYDPYGTTTLNSASNYMDYIALGGYAPVSATNDYYTTTFSQYYQRMSLGAYNTTGFNVSNYQARIIGGPGTFGSGNSWYNTATPRTVGWHHARIIIGIPNASNFAPVWMYIDNLTNATVTSSTTGTNTGFNLIEMNHANSSSGYYDDLTFRAANDPWIIEHPVSQTVNSGQSALFNTVAVGTSYQWQFNGVNIAGATTSAYSIASVDPTNAGNYACVITGTNGALATSNALLSVTGPPSIATQPSSLTVTQNQSATFSVTASGTGPLSFQWQFNSAPISGATATSYTVTNSVATNAGVYSVTVTNSFGSITSSNAMLSVLLPAQFQSLSVLGDRSLQLSMSGTAFTNYVLEISTNLANWTPLSSISSSNGFFQFNDASAATNAERFYRLRLGP
jgi:sugar lactone lactonase YvrE